MTQRPAPLHTPAAGPTPSPGGRVLPRGVLQSLAALLVLINAGCNMAGALAHKFVGPPPVPAQYRPAKQRMLVLVENYRNPSASMLDAQRLAGLIGERLTRHRIAPVVDPDRLETVRADPAYDTMTIPAIGRATGAEQVLYVNVQRIGVQGTVGAEMIKGTAEMTVRVVDAATGDNRWPIHSGGHPVTLETPWLRQGEGANEVALREQMSRQAADYIVRLFRKYHAADQAMERAMQ